MPVLFSKSHVRDLRFRKQRLRNPVIASISIAVLSAGCVSMSDIGLSSLPVKTKLLSDASASMLATGQFEKLSHAICDGIKVEARAGDNITLIPYAANSISTHCARRASNAQPWSG